MKTKFRSSVLSITAGLIGLMVGELAAADRPVDGIADNSFLVEEAYNQEAGVVQHILGMYYNVTRQRGPDDCNWDNAFTQEWPFFNQTHQLSYTVPFSFLESGGRHESGIGDVLLNYRWQAIFKEDSLLALAPRLSLVLPTGNEHRGLGEGTLGFQWNLPFSTAIADRWFVHLNAGGTFLPDPASTGGRSVYHHNIGASLIYAATPTLHLMLEAIGNWEESLDARGRRQYDFSPVVSPGVRKAFNFDNDSQLVLGLAAPIGVGGHAPDYGVFLYVSFEHFFRRSE